MVQFYAAYYKYREPQCGLVYYYWFFGIDYCSVSWETLDIVGGIIYLGVGRGLDHYLIREYEMNNTLEVIRRFNAKVKNWDRQQCLDYLVKLGTHNPDGTIHKNYGGK